MPGIAVTVLEATFAHSLNTIGTPVLVVEMGVGMRVTKEYCKELVDGIFVEMKDLGIWQGEVIEPKEPIISTDGEVHYLNAGFAGVFISGPARITYVRRRPVGEEPFQILLRFMESAQKSFQTQYNVQQNKVA